jgi:2-isopropylmalate synthase
LEKYSEMESVTIYDTTLRDGTQMEGISLSVGDKLKVAVKLDELGVHFIEDGWSGSNPKDAEFFKQIRSVDLKNCTLTAFGSTRKAGGTAETDANLKALLDSEAPVITLVGKSWDMHVEQVLETSLEENLAMVRDSITFLCEHGRRVIFDAEPFFDGFKANPAYTMAVLRTAADAGAEYVMLCDTNGGSTPTDVFNIVGHVHAEVQVALGIHCHNDTEMAVANSIAAVQAGATQVQGIVNGYGERCGNANLISVIGSLNLKLRIPSVPEKGLAHLTEVHRFVSEVVNLPPTRFQAYVGESAFTHKAGLHASAVVKLEQSYQHIDPELVGNAKRIVVSELSGRGNIAVKLEEAGLSGLVPKERMGSFLELLKQREADGFQYEGAEASFELLVRRLLGGYQPPFELVDFMVVMEKRRRPGSEVNGDEFLCEAMVKVRVNGQVMHTVAEGNGPVNALDAALRKGLTQAYPSLQSIRLEDYKVRVVEQGSGGTGATVRVLVESSDGPRRWGTVGASSNIIEASWQALVDSMEYTLVH